MLERRTLFTAGARRARTAATAAITAVLLMAAGGAGGAQGQPPAAPLQDRGPGVPTSNLGTYVGVGELLVEPAFEYRRNRDLEYNPVDLGFASPSEYKGRYRESEELLFLAYGLSDRLAVELEAGLIQASLRKAANDTSALPERLTESGLGKLRTRLDWRWLTESGRRPEVFSYGEVFFPHDRGNRLVGSPDWVANAGAGVTRGFRWGTLTLRAGIKYEAASASVTDWQEYAVEYLKRLSSKVSIVGAVVVVEGDEGYLVTQLQWHMSPRADVKLTNRFGVTAQALSWTSNSFDWAPGIGVVLRFPSHR